MERHSEVIAHCGPCKAAKRPRYNARVLADALEAGHRYATAHGVTAIVIPQAYGYSIDYDVKRLPYSHPYYAVEVDGTITHVTYQFGK